MQKYIGTFEHDQNPAIGLTLEIQSGISVADTLVDKEPLIGELYHFASKYDVSIYSYTLKSITSARNVIVTYGE